MTIMRNLTKAGTGPRLRDLVGTEVDVPVDGLPSLHVSCADCRESFPRRSLWQRDGVLLCTACESARERLVETVDAPAWQDELWARLAGDNTPAPDQPVPMPWRGDR